MGVTANPKTPAKPSNSMSAKKIPIDINSATKKQLMTLPEVGESHAKKIIENRPYKTKIQLKEKHIVPVRVYYNIVDNIAAR